MAVSSQPGGSRASRKILLLGVGVVAVAALYTGAWYYGAGEIRSRLQMFMADQSTAGVTIECGGLDVRGFPFRYEVFCNKPALADLSRGGSADAAALRTAAQVYAPWHIVWEMDGPLDATLATGEKLQLNWTNLQSSLQLKTGGLERTSLLADGLQMILPPGGTNDVLTARAAHGEAHVRQNGEDLDLAALLKDVSVTLPADEPAVLPTFSASAEITLAKKAGVTDGRITGQQVLHPAEGEVRRLVLDFGEGRVATLTGPFSIGEDGLVSGRLALEAENFTAFQPLVAAAMPDDASSITTVMGAVKAMADAKGTVRVNLVIDKGQVLLGFIPIGVMIPPV